MKTGLFIGRFQPFHNGHLKDIKDVLREVDEIVIGIGSINESKTEQNPFTVEERKTMIDLVLKNKKIKNYKYIEIPDFNNDKKWVEYIIKLVPQIDAIYTGNAWTEKCFTKAGYQIDKVKLIKNLNSTKIRDFMKNGKYWKRLVPKEVYQYLLKNKLNKIT